MRASVEDQATRSRDLEKPTTLCAYDHHKRTRRLDRSGRSSPVARPKANHKSRRCPQAATLPMPELVVREKKPERCVASAK
jgi:hypothetical protein